MNEQRSWHPYRPDMVSAVLLALALAGSGAVGLVSANAPRSQDSAAEDLGFQNLVLIQLAVSDLDRSIRFYTETLGFELEQRLEDPEWAHIGLGIDGLRIGLGVEDTVEGSGTTTFNLAVGDIEAARATLEARGVVFSGPTTTIPGSVRLAEFTDPDGNRIRLAGPPPRGESRDPRQSAGAQ